MKASAQLSSAQFTFLAAGPGQITAISDFMVSGPYPTPNCQICDSLCMCSVNLSTNPHYTDPEGVENRLNQPG